MIVYLKDKGYSIKFPDDMSPKDIERVIYTQVYNMPVLEAEKPGFLERLRTEIPKESPVKGLVSGAEKVTNLFRRRKVIRPPLYTEEEKEAFKPAGYAQVNIKDIAQKAIPNKKEFVVGLGKRIYKGMLESAALANKLFLLDKVFRLQDPEPILRKLAKETQPRTATERYAYDLAESLGGLLITLPLDAMTGAATKGALLPRVTPRIARYLAEIPDFAIGMGLRGAIKGTKEGGISKGLRKGAENLAWGIIYGKAGETTLVPKLAALGAGESAYNALKKGRLPTKEELKEGTIHGASLGIIFSLVPWLKKTTKVTREKIALARFEKQLEKLQEEGDFPGIEAKIKNLPKQTQLRKELREALGKITDDVEDIVRKQTQKPKLEKPTEEKIEESAVKEIPKAAETRPEKKLEATKPLDKLPVVRFTKKLYEEAKPIDLVSVKDVHPKARRGVPFYVVLETKEGRVLSPISEKRAKELYPELAKEKELLTKPKKLEAKPDYIAELKQRGFTEAQLNKASDETIRDIYEKGLKPEQVSILLGGKYKVTEGLGTEVTKEAKTEPAGKILEKEVSQKELKKKPTKETKITKTTEEPITEPSIPTFSSYKQAVKAVREMAKNAPEHPEWEKVEQLKKQLSNEPEKYEEYKKKIENLQKGFSKIKIKVKDTVYEVHNNKQTLEEFADTLSKIAKKAVEIPQIAKKTELPEDIALYTEIFPGARAIAGFIDKSIIEPIKGKLTKNKLVKGVGKLVENWLVPNEVKEITRIKLRHSVAELTHLKDQAWKAAQERVKWWDEIEEPIRLAFMHNIETKKTSPKDMEEIAGDKTTAKLFSSIAKEYRTRLDKIWEESKSYEEKLGYIEGYFPHIWENPEEAERWIGSYVRKIGKPAFMKRRYWRLIKDGMEAGLKLKTTNPEKLVVTREIAGFQHVTMRRFLDEMKELGWLKFHRGIKRPPYGWEALDRGALKVYFPTKKGMVQAGEWIMPAPAADIVNNYLSPSLWSNPKWYGDVFRGFMAAKNTTVAIKLALSLWHFFETTVSSISTHGIIAARKIGRGDLKGCLKALAEAPLSPALAMKTGDIIEAWYHGAKTPEQAQVIDLIKRGLGRVDMSQQWRYGFDKQWDKVWKNFKEKNIIGATFRLIPAAAEAIQKPLMEWYVPRLKIYNYLKEAKDWIEAHPNASEMEIDKMLAKLADSVDNRFGQLNYDNLLWNRYARDIGVASSLSMGWNLGTIREFGGAFLDTARLVKALAKGEKGEITSRMLYALIYPTVWAAIGGLITYLNTGKPPEKLLDYFYPKTGRKYSDGTEERLMMPTMCKEFFASKEALRKYGLVKGIGMYFWHKTAPVISMTLDVLSNKDFYNVEIRDPHAPALEQAKQLAEFFILQGGIPISVAGYLKTQRETGKKSLAPFLGFPPAPRYITATPIQKEIFDLYQKRWGGIRTKEEWERTKIKKEIRDLLQRGEAAEAKKKFIQAIREKKITTAGALRFLRQIRLTSDIRAFSALPDSDQRYLLNKMSYNEILKYGPYAKKAVREWLLEKKRKDPEWWQKLKKGAK